MPGPPPDSIPTPALIIDAAVVRGNLDAMASYVHRHRLGLRPHTKTHKSLQIGRMQMERGASGLTVAKAGEAEVMARVTDDLLVAYPVLAPSRCELLARLARDRTVRISVDSPEACAAIGAACRAVATEIGILVDLDVGHHRTGVQSPAAAFELAQVVERSAGLRLDGLLFFPGHITGRPDSQEQQLVAVDAYLGQVIDLWRGHGLAATIVSGGSTPTALTSHRITHLTEIRPGTYVFNDMNCVHGGSATIDECAARVVSTVVSTAVPGQVVLDAGTKTLTSDRCGPAPDSGHGFIVEMPDATITRLYEEHAQVDVSRSALRPKVGQRVTIVPNHICPCINLQDRFWWQEPGHPLRPIPVDARGKVF